MRNDLLDQHRTLVQNSKCCIHCRNLSMPWSEYKHVCKNQPFQNTNLYDRFKLFNISHIYLYFTAVQFYKYNFSNHSENFHNRIENDQIFHSHLIN